MIKQDKPQASLARLCGLLGVTRQAYYQNQWREMDLEIEHQLVLSRVREIRLQHPVIGARKLQVLLQPFLLENGVKMGRDALFDLLAENRLLVIKRRRPHLTTYSRHWLHKYPNLIRDLVPERINQIWVSDITYLRTNQGYVYISLVTDLYSHRLMGYHLSNDLAAVSSCKALEMALQAAGRVPHGLIHHSDRGVQYCSAEYVKLLQDNGIRISMTEKGDPLENAVAERMNGIIKNEYILQHQIRDSIHAMELLDHAAKAYNTIRPHMSCSWNTPDKTYAQKSVASRMWKNYYKKREKQNFESRLNQV